MTRPDSWKFSSIALLSLFAPLAFGLAGCDKGTETTPPDADADTAVQGDPTADPKDPDPMEDAAEVDAEADDSAEQTEAALTIASFEEAIQAHLDDVADCFAEAKARDAELSGTYEAHFEIGLEGKVTKVTTADNSDIQDDEMNACVLEKSASWQFDKPGRDEPMEMNFPFKFAE